VVSPLPLLGVSLLFQRGKRVVEVRRECFLLPSSFPYFAFCLSYPAWEGRHFLVHFLFPFHFTSIFAKKKEARITSFLPLSLAVVKEGRLALSHPSLPLTMYGRKNRVFPFFFPSFADGDE